MCKVIPVRRVFAIKQDVLGNIQRLKARLLAKGLAQQEGVDSHETYAQVCNLSTWRVLFSLVASGDLHLEHLDVTTAFLNGILESDCVCGAAARLCRWR